MGTTVRVYDPSIDAWQSTWISAIRRSVQTFVARKVGEEIVLECKTNPDYVCKASYWVKSGEKHVRSVSDPGLKGVVEKFAAFSDIEPLRHFGKVIERSR